MADKPHTTKLHQLIMDNRKNKVVEEAVRMANERKNRTGIEVSWVAGLYNISFDIHDYEILVEVKTPGSAMIPNRDENISVFYQGVECTSSFVDQKTGRTIAPTGNNLARVMALVIQKDMEENS